MDDIIEFVVELILEFFVEIMQSTKMPFFLRFIIYLACSAFLLGISGLLVWCACNEPSKILAFVLLVLSIVVFGIFVGMTYTIFFKEKAADSDEDDVQ